MNGRRGRGTSGSPRYAVTEGHRDVYEQVYHRLRGHRAPLQEILLPRLKMGGVVVVVYAVCGDTVDHAEGTDRPMWAALEHIDQFFLEAEQPDSGMMLVRWREDLEHLSDGRIRFLFHFEGGSPLEGSVGALRSFYRLGLRSMQLVHNRRNSLGDGVAERGSGGGLTRTGEAVLREVERLGIVVDLAHASEATFDHALRVATRPVVVSHSNCASVCTHVRNLSDKQLGTIRENGGLVGVNLIAAFVDAERPTIDRLIDHIEHLAGFIGIDHVYVGGDSIKYEGPRSLRDVRYASPEGVFVEDLEEADQYPNLAAALLRRGYKEADVAGVMGANLIRYLRQTLPSRTQAMVTPLAAEQVGVESGR